MKNKYSSGKDRPSIFLLMTVLLFYKINMEYVKVSFFNNTMIYRKFKKTIYNLIPTITGFSGNRINLF